MIEKFGFSPYEAQVYETILASDKSLEASTISKLSGVPKAKVYEVITKLLDKGMLLNSVEGKKKRYKAISIEQVVTKLTSQFQSDIEELKNTQWKKAKPDNRVWNLATEPAVNAYGQSMIESAQTTIKISTWKELLFQYLPLLREKQEQGVTVELHVVGKIDTGLSNVSFFFPSSTQTNLKKFQNIVVDGKEIMFAIENEYGLNAIITQSEALVDVFRDFFYRDVILSYLDKHYRDVLYKDPKYVSLISNLNY